MNTYCKEIVGKCLQEVDTKRFLESLRPGTTENTQKITSCFYHCFKDTFVKWASILYKSKYPHSIDFIADISFTDGIIKLKETIELQQLYNSNATLKTLLYSFCRFKLLENLQTENRKKQKEKQLITITNKSETEQAIDDSKEKMLLMLEHSLKNMDNDEKEIIEWRHLQQKSNKEIAEKLGITVESATNKIYRCMEKLRTHLKEKK